jgi:putative ABC transport system permease protein
MLQIKNIHKEYKTGNLIQKALDDVSLNLRDNEFVAILGPSGSGKTTLLNIIGGLDRYDNGDLIINGISTKKYKDRDWDSYRNHTIGFVFQSYNLIPHQTLLANVELALTISGFPKSKRKQKALEALEKVGLVSQAHKKPNQLSGGQMQRVAIARALVNDPDILLADEPTGALDSETSVQVMELLKEVAKDRLVVMVTHNPELAEKYATRIVNLKDGVIRSDTDPYIIENETNKKAEHKNMGKTSMSFLTSLFLSFNNLKTKKGRTALVSFAGSIGIIGIALILSLSNGVNNYIKSIEEETLSEYPIQIQSTGIDISSMLVNDDDKKSDDKNNDINVTARITNMFSKMGSNDLASLRKYLESSESNIYEYSKSIEYQYDVTPIIYSSDINNLRQINPDTSFSSLGIGSESTTNSLMSSMMSTDVFYQMPSDTKLFEDQYDIKAGKLPTNYNECVVVLTSSGNISDFMLYTLGLRDYSEFNNIINQFLAGKTAESPEYSENRYSYEDMLGITFKLINSSDRYEYDDEYKIWRDKSENTDYMKNVVENGEDLKIVGVIQPKEGATAPMLQAGIGYSASLTNYIIDKSYQSQIVKEQLASPEINVFTGKRFDDTENNSSLDMSSLIEVDSNAIKSAFKIDQSKIKVDFSNMNNLINQTNLPELDINDIMSKLEFSISNDEMKDLMTEIMQGYNDYIDKYHPDANLNNISEKLLEYINSKEAQELIKQEIEKAIKENGKIEITQDQMKEIMTKVLDGFKEYAKENNIPDTTKLEEYLSEYLQSEEVKTIVSNRLTKIMQSQNLEKQISNIMNDYMKSAVTRS